MHSDNTWMKIQKYSENVCNWNTLLSGYNWYKLFLNIDSFGKQQSPSLKVDTVMPENSLHLVLCYDILEKYLLIGINTY